MDKSLENSVDKQEELENKTNEDLSDLKNEVNSNDKEKSKISVSGSVRVWDIYFANFAATPSEHPGIMLYANLKHEQSWLSLAITRADDLSNDPKYPWWKVTVLEPKFDKKFWKNKNISFCPGAMIQFFDNNPEWNGVTAYASCSFSEKHWWTFEWKFLHKFQKWADSDAFRASISKKINDALSLTANWWYETGYSRHFYGAIGVNINLWNWFWVQLNCIAKNGKLKPIAGIIYKFSLK